MHFVTVSVVVQFICEHAGIITLSPLFACATAEATLACVQSADVMVFARAPVAKRALTNKISNIHRVSRIIMAFSSSRPKTNSSKAARVKIAPGAVTKYTVPPDSFGPVLLPEPQRWNLASVLP